MSLREKLEEVQALLINEEHERAAELFHEAFVEAARNVHKRIMEEEDWLSEEEDEALEEMVDPEEAEEQIESEELGDSQEFITDEELLGEEEDDEDMEGEEEAEDELEADLVGDEEAEDMEGEEAEEDIEDRVDDLEADLNRLKAEFEELQALEDEEHGEEYEPEEAEDMEAEEEMAEESADVELEEEVEKAEEVEEAFDELDESFELEAVSGENKEAQVGTGGEGFKPNMDSVLPKDKADANDPDAKGVDPNAAGTAHEGFDREDAPATQKFEKRKNVRDKAADDQSKVEKEGDTSALINKTETEFGGPNVDSPIGSKGSKRSKDLTEGKKRAKKASK